MTNNKIIVLAGIAALITSMVVMNIQNVSASAFANGSSDGKANGHRDAIRGYPADDSCDRDDNDYCLNYRIAYNAEYWWTKFIQKK